MWVRNLASGDSDSLDMGRTWKSRQIQKLPRILEWVADWETTGEVSCCAPGHAATQVKSPMKAGLLTLNLVHFQPGCTPSSKEFAFHLFKKIFSQLKE